MAYPPLHRKLFKSDGAGPELKEEIVPHELTKRVTAPSYTVTNGGGKAHNNMPPHATYFCWERTE